MIIFAFDIKKRKVGCALLQAAFGGNINNFDLQRFGLNNWTTTPTPDLKLYTVANQEELDKIINICVNVNNMQSLVDGVSLTQSNGRGKSGKMYCYIRPKKHCFNRSRKVGGFTEAELFSAIMACIKKWYNPIQYFNINEYVIGSNSEENALKEWWRVCDKKYVDVRIEIKKQDDGKETM